MAENTKTITIRVTPELHREIKMYVASQGMTTQDYLRGLIEADLESKQGEEVSDD